MPETCYKTLKPYVDQACGSEITALQYPGQKTLLSTRNRVLLTFMWFQLHWCYSEVLLVFGVNESYVSQELHHIVPIIYWVYCYEIQWPSAATRALLEGTMGEVNAGALASMDFTISPC